MTWQLATNSSLEIQLEELRIKVKSRDFTLKTIRIDNEFVTSEITTWAALCSPAISLQPCIPHEHHSIGDIERFNRSLEDAVFKKLYGKPHLTVQYWGYAYLDHIFKANLIGSIHGPLICPYEAWNHTKPDLQLLPMLPFGSIVMAHIPLAQQTALGPRSILHYSVGTSELHLGGLQLFNPLTKRLVVRRTFKVLGPIRPDTDRPTYELTAEGEITTTLNTTPLPADSADVDDFRYLITTIWSSIGSGKF